MTPLRVIETRGPVEEGVHRVHAAVMDAAGTLVRGHGDTALPIVPRSSMKALQALALVESGGADAAGFSDTHLALACASHSGEPDHVAGVSEMLAAVGLSEDALLCGVRPPVRRRDRDALREAGKAPGPLHHWCSGKHAGMLALAVHRGHDVADYIAPTHPVQREIAAVLGEVTGVPHTPESAGVDGCSVPTYALPLDRLAHAFARLAAGDFGSDTRNEAGRRLLAACLKHPHMIAGEGRSDTVIMTALGEKAMVKTGGDTVYTAALPGEGLGIALKVDAGSTVAATAALTHLLAELLPLSDPEQEALTAYASPARRNDRGVAVGRVTVRC